MQSLTQYITKNVNPQSSATSHPQVMSQISEKKFNPYSQDDQPLNLNNNISNTALVSDRVSQLKKEIEDLDERLASTNTINLRDMQPDSSAKTHHQTNHNGQTQSHQNNQNIYEQFSSDDDENHYNYQFQNNTDLQNSNISCQDNINNNHHQQQQQYYEIEDHIFKNSNNFSNQANNKVQQNIKNSKQQQIKSSNVPNKNNNISNNNNNNLNLSSFINNNTSTFEGEVSFDFEKILQKRNNNIKQAFETNLQQKSEQIQQIFNKIQILKKECEAKLLKLTHLKYERENLIHQIHKEEIKKEESKKEGKDMIKKIQQKKKEDEMAYNLAQEEIKRNIKEQEQTIKNIQQQIKFTQNKLKILFQQGNEQSQMQTSQVSQKLIQQEGKVQSLRTKNEEVQLNVDLLKTFLKQIHEEIQMTQEDLSSKLMQRAELVAQREELDQMLEMGKAAFGKDFQIYLKMLDSSRELNHTSIDQSLEEDYLKQKMNIYFKDILNQMKQVTNNKDRSYQKIDSMISKIDKLCQQIPLDKVSQMVVQLGVEVGIQLDRKLLITKFQEASLEKDQLFKKRETQLKEINSEIKRFEKVIKDNINMVDNMILPQLKAMTTTHNEHKNKYKKLKQALFVLKERLKKAEKDKDQIVNEQNKLVQQSNTELKIKQLEQDLHQLQQSLDKESLQMQNLNENAIYVEREYRRAQQALYLKEREIHHRYGNEKLNTSTSQLSQTLILAELQEEEKIRKRLGELEQRIAVTIAEKEEANTKLVEFQRIYKEAKDSYEHAQQMMQSTQRILDDRQFNNMRYGGGINNQQQKEIPNNRRHYKSTQVRNEFQDEYQATAMTENGSEYTHGDTILIKQQRNLKQQQQQQIGKSQKIAQFLSSNTQKHQNKENGTQKSNKITRIDLSKVLNQSTNNDFLNSQTEELHFNNLQNSNISLMSNNSMMIDRYITTKQQQQQSIDENKIQSKNATSGTNISQIQQFNLTRQQLQSLQNSQIMNQTNNNLSPQMLMEIYQSENYKNQQQMSNEFNYSGLGDSNFYNWTEENNGKYRAASQLTFNNTYNNQVSTNQYSDQDLTKRIQIYDQQNLPSSSSHHNNHHRDFSITNQSQPPSSNLFNNNSNTLNDTSHHSYKSIIVGSGKINDSTYKHNNIDANSTSNHQNYQSSQCYSDTYINNININNNNNNNSSMIMFDNVNNQSCLVDNSIAQCLDEINYSNNNNSVLQQQDQNQQQQEFINNSSILLEQNMHMIKRQQRNQSALRRSSIETAEFYQQDGDNNNSNINYNNTNIATIDVSINEPLGNQRKGMKSPEINRQQINNLYQSLQNQGKKEHNNNNQQFLKTNDLISSYQVQKQLACFDQEFPTHQQHIASNSGSISPQPVKRFRKKSLDCTTTTHNSNKPKTICSISNMIDKRRLSSVESKYLLNQITNSGTSLPHSNFHTIHNHSCHESLAHQQYRSNSRKARKYNHKQNKSVNNVDSSIVLKQSVNSSLINPITMSLNANNYSQCKNSLHQNSCNSNMEQDYLHFSRVEVSFAERIIPLLDGCTFYKKFSQRQSLNENAFDPLNADKFPPETCGYGIRVFQLDKSLMMINIKQSLKNAVETSIPLSEIVKPILPQTTMDIIRAQKQYQLQQQSIISHHQQSKNPQRMSQQSNYNQQLFNPSCLSSSSSQHSSSYNTSNCNQRKNSRNNIQIPQAQALISSGASSSKDLLEEFLILETKGGLSHLAKIGIVNKNSELYRQKCLNSTFYPFSLALTKGRVELIATSYEVLKNWIIGINLMVSNRKHIGKLRQLMDIKLD